jgi:hypothetical protein
MWRPLIVSSLSAASLIAIVPSALDAQRRPVPARVDTSVRQALPGQTIETGAIDKRPPGPGPDVTATGITPTSIKLSWNAVAGAVGYAVIRDPATSPRVLTPTPFTATSFQETGIPPNTTVPYAVIADFGPSSPNSPGRSATVSGATQPGVNPSGFTAQLSGSEVMLSWIAVPGASKYWLFGPRFPGQNVTGTWHTVTGVGLGEHTYQLTTLYEAGGQLVPSGAYPAVAKVTRAGVNPSGFTATSTGSDVKLSWNAVPGASWYLLQGAGVPASGQHVTGTSHTVTGVGSGEHTYTLITCYQSASACDADPTNPAKASVTIAGPPASKKYRVTLTGFKVHNQTIEEGGYPVQPGDDVFISADVKYLDINGKQVIQGLKGTARSKIFGNIFEVSTLGVQAGSASGGGFKTGDEFAPTPANASLPGGGTGSTGPHILPLVLWEGNLVKGSNAVVVTPTVWEWDHSQDMSTQAWTGKVWTDWVDWGVNAVQKLQGSQGFANLVGTQAMTVAPLTQLGPDPALSVTETVLGPVGSRPIGAKRAGGNVSFNLQSVTLNYDNVQQFLSQPNIWSAPPGIIPVRYSDTGASGGGDYAVYLKIETVN